MAEETPTPEPEAAPEAAPDVDAADADAAAVEAPPEPDPVHQELLARLRAGLGDDAVLETADALGDLVVRVRRDDWGRAALVCRSALECDYLSFVSGIDWMPAPREGGEEAGGDTTAPVQPTEATPGAAGSAGRLQVFAHLQSTGRHWGLTLKCDVDEAEPSVPSWVAVYPGADWHERECWEMFGIAFEGHPSLRRLYLPADFEGHPLRKDFPLLARVVKPWPGLVDVEPMPEEPVAVGAAPEEAPDGPAGDAPGGAS